MNKSVRPELTIGSLFSGIGGFDLGLDAGWTSSQLHAGWSRRPAVRRVDDGIPSRVDRMRSLGNAVCPPVAQWLGDRIVAAHIDGSGASHA